MAQPICSRCERLHLKCIGSGETRYQFRLDKRSLAFRRSSPAPARVAARTPPPLVHIPTNDTTRLQSAFVAKLRPGHDLRYSILYRWGFFLTEIPSRLGSSQALDAAANALLARHAEISLRQNESNSQVPAMMYYNQGLSALRDALKDEQTATSMETLCAVMLLVYCQVPLVSLLWELATLTSHRRVPMINSPSFAPLTAKA